MNNRLNDSNSDYTALQHPGDWFHSTISDNQKSRDNFVGELADCVKLWPSSFIISNRLMNEWRRVAPEEFPSRRDIRGTLLNPINCGPHKDVLKTWAVGWNFTRTVTLTVSLSLSDCGSTLFFFVFFSKKVTQITRSHAQCHLVHATCVSLR